MRRMCLHASLGLVYLVSFAAASSDVGIMTVYVSPEISCIDPHTGEGGCRRILDIQAYSHPDTPQVLQTNYPSKESVIYYGEGGYTRPFKTPDICYQPSPRPPASTCFELARRNILIDDYRPRFPGRFTARMRISLYPETTPNGKYELSYYYRGDVYERPFPPTPTKCTAESVPIDFGSINLREINGRYARNFIKFRCNAKTRVTATFTDIGLGNTVKVKPNLFANLSIDGRPGNVPVSVTVPKDQLTSSVIEATLTTTGDVDGGPFTVYGLYRITFY